MKPENRSHQGYDQSTPGCGIVIYRVDETVTPSNSANNGSADPLVKVIQADGQEDLENGQNRGDVGDPYPGFTRNRDLTDSTTPNARFDTGAPSGLNMHVDLNGLDGAGCGATMQVDVKYVGWDIPNEFVVGYGLDYRERYRNLRDIGTLSPRVYS